MPGERLRENFDPADDAQQYEPRRDSLRKLAESAAEQKWEPSVAEKLGERLQGWANLLALPTEQPDLFSREWYEHFSRGVSTEIRETIPIVKQAVELLESRDFVADTLRTLEYQKEIFSLRATIYRNLYNDSAQAEHYARLAQSIAAEMTAIRDIVAKAKATETQH